MKRNKINLHWPSTDFNVLAQMMFSEDDSHKNVTIATKEGLEITCHSCVLAAVSEKMRHFAKAHSLGHYRISTPDFDCAIWDILLQLIYLGQVEIDQEEEDVDALTLISQVLSLANTMQMKEVVECIGSCSPLVKKAENRLGYEVQISVNEIVGDDNRNKVNTNSDVPQEENESENMSNENDLNHMPSDETSENHKPVVTSSLINGTESYDSNYKDSCDFMQHEAGPIPEELKERNVEADSDKSCESENVTGPVPSVIDDSNMLGGQAKYGKEEPVAHVDNSDITNQPVKNIDCLNTSSGNKSDYVKVVNITDTADTPIVIDDSDDGMEYDSDDGMEYADVKNETAKTPHADTRREIKVLTNSDIDDTETEEEDISYLSLASQLRNPSQYKRPRSESESFDDAPASKHSKPSDFTSKDGDAEKYGQGVQGGRYSPKDLVETMEQSGPTPPMSPVLCESGSNSSDESILKNPPVKNCGIDLNQFTSQQSEIKLPALPDGFDHSASDIFADSFGDRIKGVQMNSSSGIDDDGYQTFANVSEPAEKSCENRIIHESIRSNSDSLKQSDGGSSYGYKTFCMGDDQNANTTEQGSPSTIDSSRTIDYDPEETIDLPYNGPPVLEGPFHEGAPQLDGPFSPADSQPVTQGMAKEIRPFMNLNGQKKEDFDIVDKGRPFECFRQHTGPFSTSREDPLEGSSTIVQGPSTNSTKGTTVESKEPDNDQELSSDNERGLPEMKDLTRNILEVNPNAKNSKIAVGKGKVIIQNHINIFADIQKRDKPKTNRTYECNRCDSTFIMKDALQKHSCNQWLMDNFTLRECKSCNTGQMSIPRVAQHFLEEHTISECYICKLCEQGFENRSELRNHLECKCLKRRNRKIGEMSSQKCSKSQSSQSTIPKLLMNQNSQNKAKSLLKKACANLKVQHKTTFNVHKDLRKVKKTFSTLDICEFHCHLCTYLGKTVKDMMRHMKAKHGIGIMCKLCKKIVSDNHSLRWHGLKNHFDKAKDK